MSVGRRLTVGTMFAEDEAALPAGLGAYALGLELARPTAVESRRFGRAVLPGGRYLYCGSAWGPGGLRARVARHLRREKTVRWHVDQLTRKARFLGVFAIPGGRECALVTRLLPLVGGTVPLPGFGSSDCRSCPSHLVSWPEGVSGEALMRLFAGTAG